MREKGLEGWLRLSFQGAELTEEALRLGVDLWGFILTHLLEDDTYHD